MAQQIRPPIDRFMDMVEVESVTGCWIWQGHHVGSKSRYGRFQPTNRGADRAVYAHRWSYEHFVGVIPEGYEIDHLCKRPSCVNPEHLEPVTPEENSRRARLTVCRKGHDLTKPENQRFDEKGRRRGCMVCRRESLSRRLKGSAN